MLRYNVQQKEWSQLLTAPCDYLKTNEIIVQIAFNREKRRLLGFTALRVLVFDVTDNKLFAFKFPELTRVNTC